MRVDEATRKKLADAVAEAEKHTAGEIVVVIANRSSGFAGQRALFASGVSFAALIATAAAAPKHGAFVALLAAAAFVLAWLLTLVPVVTRLLVHDQVLDDAVLRAAKVAFLDRGVHQTRDRSGVLVYLSQLEHRVQILGDTAVHAKVGSEGWASYAARIARAARRDRVDDIVAVVSEIGAALAEGFPRRDDDKNELPNEVVVQRA